MRNSPGATQRPPRIVASKRYDDFVIIEGANEVAIKIGGHKLAQFPWFVLALRNDLRVSGLGLCEESVYLSLAVEKCQN